MAENSVCETRMTIWVEAFSLVQFLMVFFFLYKSLRSSQWTNVSMNRFDFKVAFVFVSTICVWVRYTCLFTFFVHVFISNSHVEKIEYQAEHCVIYICIYLYILRIHNVLLDIRFSLRIYITSYLHGNMPVDRKIRSIYYSLKSSAFHTVIMQVLQFIAFSHRLSFLCHTVNVSNTLKLIINDDFGEACELFALRRKTLQCVLILSDFSI